MQQDDLFYVCLDEELARNFAVPASRKHVTFDENPDVIREYFPYSSPRIEIYPGFGIDRDESSYQSTLTHPVDAGKERPNAVLYKIPFFVLSHPRRTELTLEEALKAKYGKNAKVTLHERLGGGAYGSVSALCVIKDCQYAVKVFTYNPQNPTSYIREVNDETAAHMTALHINLDMAVRIYDAFVFEGYFGCIVYQRAELDLIRYIPAFQPFANHEYIRFHEMILYKFYRLFIHGLFHFDMQPGNIFVTRRNGVYEPMIGDWGVSLRRTGQNQYDGIASAEAAFNAVMNMLRDKSRIPTSHHFVYDTFLDTINTKGFDTFVEDLCLFLFAFRFLSRRFSFEDASEFAINMSARVTNDQEFSSRFSALYHTALTAFEKNHQDSFTELVHAMRTSWVNTSGQYATRLAVQIINVQGK